MGIKFGDAEGKAKKGADQLAFKDGENSVRLFGDVLPRYIYWVKGKNNKDVPMECLSFDREKEKFTNVEKDWVREYFPELKCGWAYAMHGIQDGKVVVVNLKKKLFEQIKDAAADLGDPTDLESGWDVVFKRTKTGSLAFNVEYTLQVLRCKPRSLSEAERALVAAAKPIDEVIPRLTSNEQHEFLKKSVLASGEDVPAEVAGTPESVDDIPY